jgi:hypothetical protein
MRMQKIVRLAFVPVILVCGVIEFVAGEPMLGSLFVGLALVFFFVMPKMQAASLAQAKASVAAEKREAKRLAELQKSMTPAEWEAYKLQLENNKLLNEMAKRGRGATGVRTGFGVISDGSGSGDIG